MWPHGLMSTACISCNKTAIFFLFFLNVAKIMVGTEATTQTSYADARSLGSHLPTAGRSSCGWNDTPNDGIHVSRSTENHWDEHTTLCHTIQQQHMRFVWYQSTPGQTSAQDITASHWLTVTGFWSDHTWQSVCFYLLSFTISFLLYTIALFPFFPFLLSRWYATHGHLPTISWLISAVATHFSVLNTERPSAHRDRPRLYTWLWWPMWLELPMRQG